MNTLTQFSDYLRAQREGHGLSVSRFADLVGRSASTVRNWERGRARPGDSETVSAIAAVLDLDEDLLVALIAGEEVAGQLPEPPSSGFSESEWMAPTKAGSVSPSEGFFTTSPLESERLRAIPWLPTPPRRTPVDRADRGARYQLRMIGTVAGILLLLLVLGWSVGEFQTAFGDLKRSIFGP